MNTIHLNGSAHNGAYVNLPNNNDFYHQQQQSPARIKTYVHSSTTTSSDNSSAETVRLAPNYTDYDGGAGEDIYVSSNKSKEQLYMEAKDILAMVSNSHVGSSPVPQQQYGMIHRPPPDYHHHHQQQQQQQQQQHPRRPPRSKHDRDPSSPVPNIPSPVDQMPSHEAANRLLIGTTMLNPSNSTSSMSRNSPVRILPPVPPPKPKKISHRVTSSSLNGEGSPPSTASELDMMRSDRHNQVLLVSSLKRQLTDLEVREEDERHELEMEKNLLNAEWTSENEQVDKIQRRLKQLKLKEQTLSGQVHELRQFACNEVEEARMRMEAAEDEFSRLEHLYSMISSGEDEEEKAEILEQLKRQHEVLEMERKVRYTW